MIQLFTVFESTALAARRSWSIYKQSGR